MPYGTTLHFFKKGFQPKWEDPGLKNGCRLQFKLDKARTSMLWEDMLFAMVGEQFGKKAETLVGVVLNMKPAFDKMGLWLVNADDEGEIAHIRAMLIDTFEIADSEIEFQAFHKPKEEKKDGGDKTRGMRGGTRGFTRGRGGGRDNFNKHGENNF